MAFKDNAVDLGEPGKDTEFGYGYVHLEKYNTNEAAESKDGKEYQAISAPAQINKTMNDIPPIKTDVYPLTYPTF